MHLINSCSEGYMFRAVLIGAAMAAAAIGAASTASAEPVPTALLPFITCSGGTYQDVAAGCAHDPTQAPTPPPGATALCHDGDWSFNTPRARTCSAHGGVAEWLFWV